MVYRALLFSGDEKACRVLTQILTELEFHVEFSSEPFAAVKQIASQHYDALVVDCDNEQNATLLFKSARNSSSNGASLAVALVQGQGGIAKAFRIGANLVLSKPIHVEQSKGTLRTAKGLLRKAEAAKAASTAVAVSEPENTLVAPGPAALPVAAPAEFSVSPVASGALELQEEQFPKLEPAEAALLESMPEPLPVKPASAASGLQSSASQPPAKLLPEPLAIPTSGANTASATAPAKTAAVIESKIVESTGESSKLASVPQKKHSVASPSTRREAFAKSARPEDDSNAFGPTLGHDVEKPPATGNRKNFWIAAILVLASAGAINYGWPQLQPLLMSIPLVQKYFAPQQVPRAAVVPAPRPTAQQAAGGQPAVAASDGLGTQTGVAGQTPQTDVLVTSNSSGASGTDKAASASSNDAGSAQNPLQLSQEDAAALLLQKVDPVYPQAALREHVEGSVELQANIGKDGSTSNLKVVSGKPLFAAAAAAAVRQWKYKPYQLDGQPTEVQTEITVDFKLPQP